mmetsp:Transcript_1262/g.2689  ORF Transcript_1262/g.2689 Transcript_1262/m.2689 type:complete len:107 (+) Transcript_1262:323-643(+)
MYPQSINQRKQSKRKKAQASASKKAQAGKRKRTTKRERPSARTHLCRQSAGTDCEDTGSGSPPLRVHRAHRPNEVVDGTVLPVLRVSAFEHRLKGLALLARDCVRI